MEATDNNCRRFEDTLVLYYYGELGPKARAEVELHLGSCPACRAELSGLKETLDAFPSYQPARQEVKGAVEGVMKRLPRQERRARRWLAPAFAASVAAAAFAIAFAFNWFPSAASHKQPQQVVVAQADWDTLNNLDVLPDIEVIENMDTIDQIENM